MNKCNNIFLRDANVLATTNKFFFFLLTIIIIYNNEVQFQIWNITSIILKINKQMDINV